VLSQIALSVCRLELEQRGDTERVDLAIIGLIARVFEPELGEGDLAKRDPGAIGKAGAIFSHRAEPAGVRFDGEVGIAKAAEEVTNQRNRQPADCEHTILAVEADADFLAQHVEIVVLDADGEFALEAEECIGLEARAPEDRTKAEILAIDVGRKDGRPGAGIDLRGGSRRKKRGDPQAARGGKQSASDVMSPLLAAARGKENLPAVASAASWNGMTLRTWSSIGSFPSFCC
jgi:hypothetical protein